MRWRYHKHRHQNFISNEELTVAQDVIVRLAQLPYESERQLLAKRRPLPSTSPILRLNPTLDEKGILVVGGRLQNSRLKEKHPILIPKGHIARLLIFKAHQDTLHGGPSLTLCHLRQKFWVVGAGQIIRSVIHQCIVCQRIRATTSHEIMAPLPASRIQPSRPFTTTAVDYAGPITLKAQGIRTTKTFKAYIVVFVCFATKAVHLDLVSDYTSNAFIAALRRFVARRGKPHTIYTDNGTNFVGACSELKNLVKSYGNNIEIQKLLASQEINWHFMPPRSPHMGGLHEAAVKSTKRHLIRIIRDRILNFEEMSTILIQIEGILNSRPIAPLSTDPNDPEPLTPGHFLIGGPLNSPPDPPMDHIAQNALSRWQLVQKTNQHFWNRWSKEYLHTLQVRSKWHTARNPIRKEDLVIIKEVNETPFTWKLGRVIEEVKGKEGATRIFKIKTKNGIITRNVTSLIKLHLPSVEAGRLLAT